MREYLFELRKKCGYKQSDVSGIILKEFGIKVRYANIERGYLWSEITPEKAEILAFALNTEPSEIMRLEKEKGGYVGEYTFDVGQHRILNSADVPLDNEERKMAERYYPYALRVIRKAEYKDFPYAIRNEYLSREDFFEIGMLFYLRSMHDITEILKEPAENPDYLIKGVISRRIFDGIRTAIRDATAQRRKANLFSARLDDVLTEDSETTLADTISYDDLSIERCSESSVMLEELFSCLNDKQISLCRFLLKGNTIREAMRSGYTECDVFKVRFYAKQLCRYGKIRYLAENYKSGEKGVLYNFKYEKWEVCINISKKKYHMGYYADLCEALDCKAVAVSHMDKGDFISWFDKHTAEGAFIYTRS